MGSGITMFTANEVASMDDATLRTKLVEALSVGAPDLKLTDEQLDTWVDDIRTQAFNVKLQQGCPTAYLAAKALSDLDNEDAPNLLDELGDPDVLAAEAELESQSNANKEA